MTAMTAFGAWRVVFGRASMIPGAMRPQHNENTCEFPNCGNNNASGVIAIMISKPQAGGGAGCGCGCLEQLVWVPVTERKSLGKREQAPRNAPHRPANTHLTDLAQQNLFLPLCTSTPNQAHSLLHPLHKVRLHPRPPHRATLIAAFTDPALCSLCATHSTTPPPPQQIYNHGRRQRNTHLQACACRRRWHRKGAYPLEHLTARCRCPRCLGASEQSRNKQRVKNPC
jgi:hypothetical protein